MKRKFINFKYTQTLRCAECKRKYTTNKCLCGNPSFISIKTINSISLDLSFLVQSITRSVWVIIHNLFNSPVIVENIICGCTLQVKQDNRRTWKRYTPLYHSFKIGDDVGKVLGFPVKITIRDTTEENGYHKDVIINGKTALSDGIPIKRSSTLTRTNVKDKILLT